MLWVNVYCRYFSLGLPIASTEASVIRPSNSEVRASHLNLSLLCSCLPPTKISRFCKNPDANFHTHKSQSLNTFLSLLLRIRILLKRLPSRVYIRVSWDFVLPRASHASDSYITEQIIWPLASGQDIRCHSLCLPSVCPSSPFIRCVLTQTRRYVAINCTFTLFGRSHFGSYRALKDSACNQLVHTNTGLTEIPTWLSTDTFPRVGGNIVNLR